MKVSLPSVVTALSVVVFCAACSGPGESALEVRIASTSSSAATTAQSTTAPGPVGSAGVTTTGTAASTTIAPTTIAPTTTDVVVPTTSGVSTTNESALPPTTRLRATTTSTLDPSIGSRHIEAVELAGDVVTSLLTYRRDMDHRDVVSQVVGGSTRIDSLVDETSNLFVPGVESIGEVLFAQLGGMRPDSASVMVVATQTTDDGSTTEVTTRTLDVRLLYRSGAWRFDFVFDDGGAPVARPESLSPSAATVVDHPEILMADSARWDIYRGDISPTLIGLIAELAEQSPIEVTVLSSGHPFFVFATNRQSLHTSGRAVDIFSVDGRPVGADHSKDSDIYRLVESLYANPLVRSIGSPWDLDGPGGRSFTDEVHLDHLHVSVVAEPAVAP